MDGLAKIAWTNKQLDRANDVVESLENLPKFKMTPEEMQDYLNVVKQTDNLEVDTRIGDNFRGFFQNSEGVKTNIENIPKRIEQIQKELQNTKKPKEIKKLNKEMRKLKRNLEEFKDYKGAKDGLVSSLPNRYIFNHELGHALDYARDPKRYQIGEDAKDVMKHAPKLAIGTAGVGGIISAQTEEENRLRNGLIAAGVGGLVGGGLTAAGGNVVLSLEDGANDYARKIIQNVHPNDPGIITRGDDLLAAARKTYTLNNLRVLKNSLIGAGVGAGVGAGIGTGARVGLNYLQNRFNQE